MLLDAMCVCVCPRRRQGSTRSPGPLRGPILRPYMCAIGEPRVASVCAPDRPHPRRLNVYTICSLTRRCVRASFPVITPPLGVCRTRLSWGATSSGSESKSWQYRSWRSGCARRNEMCACVQIPTSNTALVELARNSPKSTMYHYPGSG